ncbi:MAG: KilA-N domain-containing protein [Planktothrix sp.]
MSFIERQVGVKELTVSQRQADGYINATKLARAYERKTDKYKNPNKWFENNRTVEFIELLSNKTGLEVYSYSGLVQKRGQGSSQETWIHPKLAISFAMWLSPEFEMMVSEWVAEWMLSGKEPEKPTIPDIHPYQRVWYQRLFLFEKNTKLPSGMWCVFEEIGKLMRNLEANQVNLPENATVDISVGRAWCHWLRESGYDTNFEQYIHYYPDKRGQQLANIYPFEILGKFHQWLQDTYIQEKFPSYVRKFSSVEQCQLISEAIGCEVKPIKKRLLP